jgi:hypothetical protein
MLVLALALLPLRAEAGPEYNVEYPDDGDNGRAVVTISGFAIDTNSGNGTGVDAVQVWACPWPSNCDSNKVFWGAATYRTARPDIGGYYGSQFTNSGFSFVVSWPVGGAH